MDSLVNLQFLVDDAKCFALVRQHVRAGIRPRRIGFRKEGDGAARMGLSDQFHAHRTVGNIDQLAGLVDHLRIAVLLEIWREKLHKRHRDAAQHLLQRADRRADAVLLDHGNGAVGDARTLGEFTLGQALEFADGLQSNANVQYGSPQ